MPVPRRRHCRSRQGKDRAHKKLHPMQLVACECGEMKLPHRVCPQCGKYDGRQVKTIVTRAE